MVSSMVMQGLMMSWRFHQGKWKQIKVGPDIEKGETDEDI